MIGLATLLTVTALQTNTWAAPAAARNVLTNAGFEAASSQDKPREAASGWEGGTRTDETPAGGARCLRQDARLLATWNCVRSTRVFPIAQGRVYCLRIHTRDTLQGGDYAIGLREVSANGSSVLYHWNFIPHGRPDWHEVEFLHRPSSEKATGLQVYLRILPDARSGSAWWDDIALTPEAEQPLEPALAPVTLRPLDTLVFARDAGKTAPRQCELRLEATRAATGGVLRVHLATSYPTGPRDLARHVWRHEQMITRAGPVRVTRPMADLAVGHYRLSVELTSPDGQFVRWRENKPIAVIDPPEVSTPAQPVRAAEIDPKGRLLVNGKPFLWVLYYHGPTSGEERLRAMRQHHGETVAQLTGVSRGQMDELYEAGIYSWARPSAGGVLDGKKKAWDLEALAEVVNETKDHPGLIAWNLLDEPEVHRVGPQAVKEAYETIRRHDVDHPIIVNLCQMDRFKEFLPWSDVASYDYYPFPIAYHLSYSRAANWTMARLTGGRKPLCPILQTYASTKETIQPPRLMPTPAQLRAELYTSVCDGATMFGFYSWYDPPGSLCLARDSEMRSYTRLLAAELRALRPFLFSGERPQSRFPELDAAGLTHLAKRVEDHVELIVVNTALQSLGPVTFGFADTEIVEAETVFEDGRPVRLDNGKITDSFEPFGVHVYRLVPR